MADYTILKSNRQYSFVVVGKSFIHPFSYYEEIAEELLNFEGFVLFDSLLSNGFSTNRFIEVFFSNGSFDRKLMRIVTDVESELMNSIYRYYYSKSHIIDSNQILADAQKFQLKNGMLLKNSESVCVAIN